MSVTPSGDYIVPKLKAETLANLVKKGLRLTGRGLEDYREIEITTHYVPNANGSAFVKLGNTQVLVGVKIELGTPYPDTPNEGTMVVSAEFVPTASPVFEPGPPDENAIELARVVDRSLREIRAIDLSKLVIIPGKRVLTVWIDIYVLDHDGNLIDASSLGALAALMTARLPKVEVKEDSEVILHRDVLTDPIPLNHKVVTVTLGKLGDVMIVDPDLEEESIMDTRLVFAVSDDGRIAGIQKSGMGPLSEEEISNALELALAKGKELIELVERIVRGEIPKKAEEGEEKEEGGEEEEAPEAEKLQEDLQEESEEEKA